MTREEFIQLAADKWPELEALQASGDFGAYERRFLEIMKELELSVMQAHLGEKPRDHRKKRASKRPSGK